MRNLWKASLRAVSGRGNRRLPRNFLWILGGGAASALILISCTTTGRTMMAPPSIAGATFMGSESCDQCHDKITRDFRTADHARLQAKGDRAKDMGCESCHGAGSKHIESGGAAGTIVNPRKDPATCFQCHLDKKAEFMLPYSHPVLSGKMSCSDCHNPHKGSASKGGGTELAGRNDTCFQCHTEQRGPFIIPHEAVREGCSTCHNPHGSPNQRMLTERNATLCLKCHTQDQTFGLAATSTNLQIGSSAHGTISNRLMNTCWSVGCHEGVHGSNTDKHLRE